MQRGQDRGQPRDDPRLTAPRYSRPDRGTSQPYSADNYPSFTLGSVNVSPMNMAAAYATVAARGIYCKPIAVAKIVTSTGIHLPVESAGCHRVLSTAVADAANFILQGVLTAPGATAGDRGIGRPAAAKTGTANDGYYAAFAGYTPTLVGYVSVFNPIDPTTGGKMLGYPHSCFRNSDGTWLCPGSDVWRYGPRCDLGADLPARQPGTAGPVCGGAAEQQLLPRGQWLHLAEAAEAASRPSRRRWRRRRQRGGAAGRSRRPRRRRPRTGPPGQPAPFASVPSTG